MRPEIIKMVSGKSYRLDEYKSYILTAVGTGFTALLEGQAQENLEANPSSVEWVALATINNGLPQTRAVETPFIRVTVTSGTATFHLQKLDRAPIATGSAATFAAQETTDLLTYTGSATSIIWTNINRGGSFVLSAEAADGGYIIADGLSRAWRRLGATGTNVSALWYGATNTFNPSVGGDIDSAPFINVAINAVNARGGGIVRLPAGAARGCYGLSTSIVLRGGVLLQGDGYQVIPGSFTGWGGTKLIHRGTPVTLIFCQGISSRVDATGSGLVRETGFSGMAIAGSTIETVILRAVAYAKISDVYFTSSRNFSVRADELFDSFFNRCVWLDCGDRATSKPVVGLFSGGSYENTNQVRFNDCTFEQNQFTSLLLNGEGSSSGYNTNKIWLTNCKFDTGAGSGYGRMIEANAAFMCKFDIESIWTGLTGQTLTDLVSLYQCNGITGQMFFNKLSPGGGSGSLDKFLGIDGCGGLDLTVMVSNAANLVDTVAIRFVNGAAGAAGVRGFLLENPGAKTLKNV